MYYFKVLFQGIIRVKKVPKKRDYIKKNRYKKISE